MKRRDQLAHHSQEYHSTESTTPVPSSFSSLPISFIAETGQKQNEVEPSPSQRDSSFPQQTGPAVSSVEQSLPASNDSTVKEKPSFMNRYVQLDQQEREQVKKEEEEFLVSRQRKTKKKKKRRKKETEGPEDEATPTTDVLHESIKENQPPTQVDLVKHVEPVLLPIIEPDNVTNDSNGATAQSTLDCIIVREGEGEEDQSVKSQDVPTNPFAHESPEPEVDYMESCDSHVTTLETPSEESPKTRKRSGAISNTLFIETAPQETTPITQETTPTPFSYDTPLTLSMTTPIAGKF